MPKSWVEAERNSARWDTYAHLWAFCVIFREEGVADTIFRIIFKKSRKIRTIILFCPHSMSKSVREKLLRLWTLPPASTSGHVAVSAVRCTEVANEAVRRWALSADEGERWGRQAACTMMYTSFLKGGACDEHDADAILRYDMRGNVCWRNSWTAARQSHGHNSAATSGTMTITKHLYNEARPYNSTVAFEGGLILRPERT